MAHRGPRPYTQDSNSAWGLPTVSQAPGEAFTSMRALTLTIAC